MRELALKVSDGTTFASRGTVVIGREDSCDVVLESNEVSRRHATIDPHPDGYLLTDSSANGTYVGTELVHRRSVRLDPEKVRAILPGGVVGRTFDPNLADQNVLWPDKDTETYWWFSDAAIAQHTQSSLVLNPAAR